MVGVVIVSVICVAGIVFLVRFFVAICDTREPEQPRYTLYAPPQSSEADRPIIRWPDDNGRSWSLSPADGAHPTSAPIPFQPRPKR